MKLLNRVRLSPLLCFLFSVTLSEFLLECLHFDCYDHIIRWRNRKEGTFKIVESQVLAMMWGMVKRKPDMNFDKMSRAMRYYYSKVRFCGRGEVMRERE